MESKELRIGNIIEYFIETDDLGWQPTEVDWQDLKEISEQPEGFNDKHRTIELTEKMLIGLGAFRIGFKQFSSFNLHGIQINFINGMWLEYVSQIDITGLHHLQNIYYFRMAEELKIDETILK